MAKMNSRNDPNIKISDLGARLANLRVDDGYALGAEVKGGVVNLTTLAAAIGLSAPRDIDDLLQNGRAPEVRAVLEAIKSRGAAVVVTPISDVSFAPLVTRPEKIICVGFNYREHAIETNTPVPKAPPLFNKFNNALNNHGGVVHLPTRVARQFDYETELVIVFGRNCRDVSEDDALDVVAGYTIGNDVSARELQTATSQFLAGKTSDGFGPVGPWLVPRGMVPDPNALKLQTWVNGTIRQDWNTRDMIFDCRKLIAYASSVMSIKAGDIMFTGTPQGVILGEKAPREERHWLKAGDEVVSSLEGLGELRVKLM